MADVGRGRRWSWTTLTSSRLSPSRSIVRTKLEPVGPKRPDVRTIHASRPRRPHRAASSCRRPRAGSARPIRRTARPCGRRRHSRWSRRRVGRRAPPRDACRRRSRPPHPVDRPQRRPRPSTPPRAGRLPEAGRARRGSVTSQSPCASARASGNASTSAQPSWPPAPVIRTCCGPAPTGSAMSCSRGRRRVGRPRAGRARRDRRRRTPR